MKENDESAQTTNRSVCVAYEGGRISHLHIRVQDWHIDVAVGLTRGDRIER